jgi:predicted nucleic acid-binding protein
VRFVVDASVALKWILPEADSDLASALLTLDNELFAPDLILPEVMGVLLRGTRQNRVIGDAAESAWALLNAALRLEPTPGHVMAAYRIAESADGFLFDAVYANLSRALDCPLVTADQGQHQQASRAGIQVLRLVEAGAAKS